MTMYLAAPALVAIVGCVLVSEKSDLWGLVVDSANAMAHTSGAGEGAGACPIPADELSIVGRGDAEKRPDGCQ